MNISDMFSNLEIRLFCALISIAAVVNRCRFECPCPRPPSRGSFSFFLKTSLPFRCRSKCPVGTIAHVVCSDFYKIQGNHTLRCLPDGRWSSPQLKCVPVCGKRRAEVRLIVHGKVASPGTFPWHVAIYLAAEGKHEFWCSGSLISEYAVLTAAHCTWKTNPERLLLALGKFYREIAVDEPNVQLIEAKRIEILKSYQDASGNYNGDLSVIFLKKSVEINSFIRPVCLDWEQKYMDRQLEEGTLGTVLGWGLTENDTFSDKLRILRLTVTSDEKCIAQQERDFRKFVTYTSFCAGFNNGTGVCNGDSGGGLTFWEEKSNSWFLQGLVSVSPRRKGTSFCDPHFYTIFTKVSLFTQWLKKLNINDDQFVIEEELGSSYIGPLPNRSKINKIKKDPTQVSKNSDPYAFIRKYFKKSVGKIGKKKFDFPHSQKILDSANFSNEQL